MPFATKGNRLILGRGGGAIVNLLTGQEIPFERRGGVYTLGMWIRDGQQIPAAAVTSAAASRAADGARSPFSRP